MKRLFVILFLMVFLCISKDANAQRFAISTNLLDYILIAPNLEVELAMNQHNTISMFASASPWRINEKYSISQITVSPEYKYWFTMPFFGHYLGANIKYCSYDTYWNSTRYDGNLLGLGATYGYSIIIGKKWNLVPNIGLGVGADFQPDRVRFIPLLTKFGLNIQMVIR